MTIVTVIPIAKGFFGENLSYFTSRAIEPGTVIAVPIRKKQVPALVISAEPASAKKADLKNLPFGLRPLGNVAGHRIFTAPFIEACKKTAQFHAAPVGSIIKSFTPKTVLESFHDEISPREIPGGRSERVVIQAPDDERLAFYKSLIREEFAKKKSVLLTVPTAAEVEQLIPFLEKGIEGYAVALYGGMPKKQMLENWSRAARDEHPLLIIGTPGFIAIPRTDLGAIVIEHESSPHYKNMSRPFVDARRALAFLADALGTRIIFGDIFLRIETLEAREQESFVTLLPPKFRSLSHAEQIIASMKKDPADKTKTPFSALGAALRSALEDAQKRNGNAFIYVHRKGIASMTVCSDCGSYLPCTRCKAPLVLHGGDEGNFFLCHKCWKEHSAEVRCPHCSSWRLEPLGIGIERVEDELAHLFPGRPLFRMDSETAPSHKRATEIIRLFYETAGAILVGTELALPYLQEPIDTIAIASIDSLFSIPDFRIHEKIFHTALTLRNKALRRFIIQTRAPERKLFDYIIRGNLIDFYRDELALRKKFNYPPHVLLIKVTREGSEAAVEQEMAMFAQQFAEWKPAIFPGFHAVEEGKARLHGLIRLDPAQWPDPQLSEKISLLTPDFIVAVDPEDIL